MFVGMKSALRAAFLCAALPLSAQAREFTLLSYNVENLFDADKIAIYDDYAETGEPNAYSPAKLLRKMESIGKVLKSFNGGTGPEVVCFNELEMDFTPDSKVTDYAAFLDKYKQTTAQQMLTTGLNDEIRGLPVEALLLKYLEDNGIKGYHVAVGQDEPDFAALASTDKGVHKKGQKNGLFSKFPIKETKSHPTPDARDILEVTLDVEGHPLIVFVNHWKSGASDFGMEQSRRFNAKTLRDRINQIVAENPNADIVMTGDFNSQYKQTLAYPHMGKTGVNDVLGSQGDEEATANATNLSVYNLWHEIPEESQRHSDQYDGKWGTLMQIMVTPGLYDFNGVQYADNSFRVVALDGINAVAAGNILLPRRWSNMGKGSGASDHFPVAAEFRTVEDKDVAKKLELVNPGKPPANGDLVAAYSALKPADCPEFTAEIASDPTGRLGEIFRVSGTVASKKPLLIKVHGDEYSLWMSNKESPALRPVRQLNQGDPVELIGILSSHKGRMQFLVEDSAWVLQAGKS
jgi:endonuclease/exonuclease/phosphatase family metal-dependent hydrolase